MKYRILGKTDLRVSVVGVGTWQFGGEWGHDYTQAEVDAIIGEAGNQGINLIDTAECYGDHLSEKFVGQAIAGKRDAWIVATKFGHQFQSHLTRTRHWQADDVRRQLEDSLRALQTDYVDLYQCHSASNDDFDNRALWKTLRGLVESGKVRHLGISLSPNTNMYQTKRAKRVGAETIQIVHNRLSRQGEADVLPACQKQNLGVLARVPLASGYLSGKYKPGATFPKNDVRGGRNPDDEAKLLREVEHIAATEVPPGIDMATWALSWCLQHPAVTCVIPGCKNAAQVISNAAAADLVSDNHPQATS